MSVTEISYSQLTKWRSECRKLFGKFDQIRVEQSAGIVCQRLYKGGKVLDVGAGVEKPLKQILGLSDDNYYSLDNDPDGNFNYTKPSEIPPPKKFDLIVLNQVLEHIRIDESVGIMEQISKHLDLQGVIIISVPNSQHPVRFWGDATHITSWPIDDLYGLIRHCGLKVTTIARYNKYPLTRNPLKRFIIKTVCKTFRMDWCDSILIVAQRNKAHD
jgi:2-polyprenyl-3-methyl-5-hydroxy-6-metoxy-1,4-benzoquinol methylase